MSNQVHKTETRLLIAYWAAGAICGMLAGALMAGVEVGSCYLESYLTANAMIRRLDAHDMVFAFALWGSMLGLSCAPFWRLAPVMYALGGRPIFASSMGASLIGCLWLLIVPEIHSQWLESRLVPALLVHLVCTIGLGALYGFLLTLLIRPLRRWLVPDATGSR
jgi:hypothetical protein